MGLAVRRAGQGRGGVAGPKLPWRRRREPARAVAQARRDCRAKSPILKSYWRRARHAHQRIEPVGVVEQRPARAGEDDGAAVEDDGVSAKLEREPGVLLDQQQRQIVLALEAVEPGEQRVDDDRRQAFERLVHQQQRRVAHQRAADRQHLLLAARELVAAVVAALGERRKEIVDPCERPAPRARRHRSGFPRPSARERSHAPAARSRCRAAPAERAAVPRCPARQSGSCRACSRVWPMIVASRVVLPTPLRPSTASVPPGGKASEIPSSTTVSP